MGLMVQPEIANFKTVTCPAYSFLIHHPSSNRKLIFDLGVRKNWEESAPYIVDRIKKGGWNVAVEKDVAQTLEDNGVPTKEIEAIVWSHYHWDHTGDPTRFPSSTTLIVGPGFKGRWPNAYPTKPDAPIREDAWKDRELREMTFDPSKLKIGRFNAFDYFGDGSFYLLDTPGHLLGHLCGLARTTKDTFIFMGGDSAHHAGEIRPTEYNPLPSDIKLTPNPSHFPHMCPGEILQQYVHPEQSATKPFYSAAPGFNENHDIAEWTIEGVEEFDADNNVLVVVAHDASLKDVVEFFPKPANEWKTEDWGKNGRWRFLADFSEGLEMAKKDGKL
jgi:glyoxylase-like metal-dependent hydrolase (beta-lactamase superfamily II)